MRIIIVMFLFVFACESIAEEKLNIPRFVSIKSSEANLRTGPSVRYPITWVYIRSSEPVEIVAEFEQWRKIRDSNGDEGWMHKTMLNGSRNIVVRSSKSNEIHKLYSKPHDASQVIAKIESESRASLKSCKKNWCLISINWQDQLSSKMRKTTGWIKKTHIWGVYGKELI